MTNHVLENLELACQAGTLHGVPVTDAWIPVGHCQPPLLALPFPLPSPYLRRPRQQAIASLFLETQASPHVNTTFTLTLGLASVVGQPWRASGTQRAKRTQLLICTPLCPPSPGTSYRTVATMRREEQLTVSVTLPVVTTMWRQCLGHEPSQSTYPIMTTASLMDHTNPSRLKGFSFNWRYLLG